MSVIRPSNPSRQPERLAQPVDDHALELGPARRRPPQHRVLAERGDEHLAEHAGPRRSRGEVGEEARVLPVRSRSGRSGTACRRASRRGSPASRAERPAAPRRRSRARSPAGRRTPRRLPGSRPSGRRRGGRPPGTPPARGRRARRAGSGSRASGRSAGAPAGDRSTVAMAAKPTGSGHDEAPRHGGMVAGPRSPVMFDVAPMDTPARRRRMPVLRTADGEAVAAARDVADLHQRGALRRHHRRPLAVPRTDDPVEVVAEPRLGVR